jgi:hypothetical protein
MWLAVIDTRKPKPTWTFGAFAWLGIWWPPASQTEIFSGGRIEPQRWLRCMGVPNIGRYGLPH